MASDRTAMPDKNGNADMKFQLLGNVYITPTPGRKNLLRIRHPWNANL
jgi:hypothetical protein